MMKLEVWLGIIFSAILAFGVAIFYKQPVHWFLFIIIIFIGLFINTVILILKVQDENT